MRTIHDSSASWMLKSIRSIALLAVAGLGLSACSEAESRDAPEGQTAVEEAPAVTTVSAGTSMTFTVDRTVSTDTDEVGAYFTATLQSPVMSTQGSQVIPAGATSRWVVTESSTQDGRSVLGVRLESIRVDGEPVTVASTVTDATIDTDDPDSDGETAAKIGVGAAAGALIGQILGRDTESTLAGAGVGAAVGTAVALSTRGGSATLPAGSRLVVQLDEPLTL